MKSPGEYTLRARRHLFPSSTNSSAEGPLRAKWCDGTQANERGMHFDGYNSLTRVRVEFKVGIGYLIHEDNYDRLNMQAHK